MLNNALVWIYFILDAEKSRVKIGVSKSPAKRIETLQIGNSAKLILLGVIPGNRYLELELHKRFKTAHVNGEWFYYCRWVKEDIDGLLYLKIEPNKMVELLIEKEYVFKRPAGISITEMTKRYFNELYFPYAWDAYLFYRRKRSIDPKWFDSDFRK